MADTFAHFPHFRIRAIVSPLLDRHLQRHDAITETVGVRKPRPLFGENLTYGVFASNPPTVLDKDGKQVNE